MNTASIVRPNTSRPKPPATINFASQNGRAEDAGDTGAHDAPANPWMHGAETRPAHVTRAGYLQGFAIYDAKTGAVLPFRDARGAIMHHLRVQNERVVNGIDVIRHAAWAVHARPEEVYTWVEIGGASYRVLPYNYIDEVVLNQQTQRNEFGQVAVYVYREAPVGTQRNLHGLCAGCRRTQEAVQLFRVKEQLFEARELADAQDRVKAGVQRGCTPAYVAKLHEWRQELEETCAMLVRSLRSTQCNCYGECDATHPVHAEHWLDLYVRGLLPEPYAVGVAAEAGLTRAQGAARLHRLHDIGEPPAEVVFVGMPPKRPRRSNRAVVTTANANSAAATANTTTTNATATNNAAAGGAINTTPNTTPANTTPGAPPPSRAASLAQEDAAFDGDTTAEGAAASLAMEVASESDGEASDAGGCTAEEDDAEPDEAPAAQQEPAAACNDAADAADDEHQGRNEDQDAKDDDATSDVAMDEQAAHSAAEAVLSSVFDDGADDDDDASASSPSGLDDDGVTAEHDSPRVLVLQRLFDMPVPIDMPCAASTLPPRARRSRSQVLEASAPPDSRSASPATPSRRASVTPNTPPTVCHRVASSTRMGPVVQDRSDAPQTSDDTSPTPTRPTDTGNKASKPARATTAAAKRAAEKEKAKQRRVAQAEREAAAQAERKAAKAKAAVARAAKQAARERAEEELLTRAVEKTTAAEAAAEAAEAAEAAAVAASTPTVDSTAGVVADLSRSCKFCLSRLFIAGQRPLAVFQGIEQLRSAWCGGRLRDGTGCNPDFNYPGSDHVLLILVAARSHRINISGPAADHAYWRREAFSHQGGAAANSASQTAGFIIDSVILAFAFFDSRCPHCTVSDDPQRHDTGLRGAMSMLSDAGQALKDLVAQKAMRSFSCGLRTVHAARLLSRLVQVLWEMRRRRRNDDDRSTRRGTRRAQQQQQQQEEAGAAGPFADGPYLHATVAPMLDRFATALLLHRASLVEKSGPDNGCRDLDDVVTVPETISAALPDPLFRMHADAALVETLSDLHAAEARHFPAAARGSTVLEAAVASTDVSWATDAPISPLHRAAIEIVGALMPAIIKFTGADTHQCASNAAHVFFVRDHMRGMELYGPAVAPRIVTTAITDAQTAAASDDDDDDDIVLD